MALGPEPDEVPIHELVRELTRQAHKDRLAPIGITFNTEGYRRALVQTVPGMDAFTGSTSGARTHYLGLPYERVNDQAELVLLKTVSGASAEAKAFRTAQRPRIALERQHDQWVGDAITLDRLRNDLDVRAEELEHEHGKGWGEAKSLRHVAILVAQASTDLKAHLRAYKP